MPVHVKCPTCGTILATPDNFPGGVIGCPQCRGQFMVPPQMTAPSLLAPAANATSPPGPPTPPVAAAPSSSPPAPPIASATSSGPPRVEMYPPGFAHPAPTAASAAAPPVKEREREKKGAKEPSAPVARNLDRTLAAYPPGVTPSLSALAVPPTASSAAQSAVAAPAMPPRQTQSARFIAADAAATRIDLGQDGKLPELRLQELKEKDLEAESEKQSNPWLLIGVFGFSILASVAMLFIDTSASAPGSTSKKEARARIEELYLVTTSSGKRRPYQEKLSQALIEHRRGDYSAERRLYREVADLLHSEGKDPFKGITGRLSSDSEYEPTDKDLERLISILLR